MAEVDEPQAAVVYVPTRRDDLTTELIAVGSGIVGRPDGSGSVLVYIEGAIHGQVNLASLADRVACAHGRMAADYPTVAKMIVPIEALVAVGTFAPGEGRIELTGPDSEALVAAWLTGDGRPLDPTELLCSRGWRARR